MSIKSALRNWLEVSHRKSTELIIKNNEESVDEKIRELNSELDFWKRWFKHRQPKKKCTQCKEYIDLWPFNETVGYYTKGNKVTHQKCEKES